MTTVWVLTHGEPFEPKAIEGVFTTRVLAREAAFNTEGFSAFRFIPPTAECKTSETYHLKDAHGVYDIITIEEFTLNEGAPQ